MNRLRSLWICLAGALCAGAVASVAAAQTAATPAAPQEAAAPERQETPEETDAAASDEDGEAEGDAPTAFAPPETRIDYDVEIVGAPSEEIEDSRAHVHTVVVEKRRARSSDEHARKRGEKE